MTAMGAEDDAIGPSGGMTLHPKAAWTGGGETQAVQPVSRWMRSNS
jgi:hypothetical protein